MSARVKITTLSVITGDCNADGHTGNGHLDCDTSITLPEAGPRPATERNSFGRRRTKRDDLGRGWPHAMSGALLWTTATHSRFCAATTATTSGGEATTSSGARSTSYSNR